MKKYGIAKQVTYDGIVQCVCIACRITKPTDTHLEYVIVIAFPQQQWLCERA